MNARNKLIKIVLPVAILSAGFALMLIMIMSRTAPRKEVKEDLGVLVEVISIKSQGYQVQVSGTGTVQARRETSITPQVSGRVTYVSPSFVRGGFFSKGQILFEIEKIDYELNVERAGAAFAKAELELIREESNAQVARQEWDRLKNKSVEANPLVLYEPQLKQAKANVASAKAVLKQARLDLERTRIYAPFNCRVRSEEIETGQYVKSGTGIGIVAGTDQAEIIIPLAMDELHWLRVPRQGSQLSGSEAIIKIISGNKVYSWAGKIVRSFGEVDERGRMARVVVVINDPYNLKKKRIKGGPDLEVGMFVEGDLKGEILENVFLLPRNAIRENDTVWTVDDDNKLRIKPVTIIRRERMNILVRSGLSDGERLVLTSVAGAADGMKLRTMGRGITE